MDKKIEDIVNKAAEEFIEKLSLKEALSIIEENSNGIISSLERTYETDYNIDNQITPENWKYFIDSLGKVINNEEFQAKCKEINCKLYCVKFFTNLKFAIAENAEASLKFELKQYFPQIVSEDGNEFIRAFFSLPFEFVSLVIRYLANVVYKDKKNLLTPQLKDAQEYFNEMTKRKNNFITEVNKISQGESAIFSIYDAQELLDVKAFFEYNATNVGTLEYIMRILTNKNTKQKLEDEFGKFKVRFMKEQILEHPSYIKFLQEIKDDLEQPYFTETGSQNKERDTTFNEFVMQYFHPEDYIPEVPEEKPKEPQAPVAEKEPEQPLAVEQPSPEELKGNSEEEKGGELK